VSVVTNALRLARFVPPVEAAEPDQPAGTGMLAPATAA
jgi:hypothetical protein